VDESYVGQQVVGLDLHRRRTVMVRMTPADERLEAVRFASDPGVLAVQIAKAGPAPEVVVEATYGWYWVADVLAEAGARLHLAHPLGVKGFAYRRVKLSRRRGLGGSVADGSTTGGVDRAQTGALPARVGAPPAQAAPAVFGA
jgi:hypothetical protein